MKQEILTTAQILAIWFAGTSTGMIVLRIIEMIFEVCR